MAKLGDGSGYYIVGSPSNHEVYYTGKPKHQYETTTSATEETSPSSLSSSAPITTLHTGVPPCLGTLSLEETTDSKESTAQPPADSSKDQPESNVFCIFPFDDEPGNATTTDTSSTELLGLEGSDSAT